MSDWLEDTLIRPRVSASIGGLTVSRPLSKTSRVALFDRSAWLDALLIWLGQIALVCVVIYVGRTLLLTQHAMPTGATISWSQLFGKWLGWDGVNYAWIAMRGYTQPATPAYSPGLPLLERGVNALTGLNPQIAGELISLVAALISYGLLRILAERELDREAARRATLYLAVFPTAFFFLTPYTESLFLAFTCGAFLAMRQARWVTAGTLIALAALTHLTGVILLAPLALEMARRWRDAGPPSTLRDWGKIAVGLAIAPLALGAFNLYLYRQFGTFFSVTRAEESVWGKGFSIPLMGFVRAGGALVRNGVNPGAEQVHILLDGAFTLALIGMAIVVWRRLPRAYGVYMAALTFLIVSTPLHNWYALMSNPRFALAAFPAFMILGVWGARPWIDRLILVFSLPLLAIFTLVFAMGGWVA